jgi:hypothetical protein
MTCPACGGALETSSNGAYARCTACRSIYMTYGGELRPVAIPPGTDPVIFARGIGFAAAGETPSAQPAASAPAPGMDLPPDPMTATKNAFLNKASNMGVRVKMGGVNVDLNKGGVAVDTRRLEKNIERKVERTVSGWIWGCVFSVFFFGLVGAILVVVGGYVGWAVVTSGSSSSSAEAASWDGKSPYVCPPNGHVTLSDVTADLPGQTAITAGGNCELVLEDVTIKAGTALSAAANAKVTLKGGSYAGTEAAIDAMGNATVTVDGAKIEGKAEKLGGAKITGM